MHRRSLKALRSVLWVAGLVLLAGCGSDNKEQTKPHDACSILLTSPNGGETWPRWITQTIRWEESGPCGSTVKIELLRDGAVCGTIANGVADSGSYRWNPVGCCGGTDEFKIRVTDWDTGRSDESNQVFSIPGSEWIVRSPNGGESWPAGSTQTISWDTGTGCGSTVKIELLWEGVVCRTIASGVANSGSYAWVPVWRCSGHADGYKIRVADWDTGAGDESNGVFSITEGAPSILVIYPNGGETWSPDSSQTILWDKSGNCGPTVKIELLRRGEVCQMVASGVANSGSYTWSPVERCGQFTDDSYEVRVTDWSTGAYDESNGWFKILAPPCVYTMISPNGGENWTLGSSQTITWRTSGSCGNAVMIYLYRYGSYCWTIVGGGGSSGSYTWHWVKRCGDNPDGYKIRVVDADLGVSCESQEFFSIPDRACSVSVTSPNGGETWPAGSSQTITWDKTGICSTVKIELSRIGSVCQTIANGIANSGNYTWNPVRQCVGNMDGYRIKVTDWDTGGSDESDGTFSVTPPPPITGMVLIPAGSYTMGSPAGEAGRGTDEAGHQVTLTKALYLCDHEVTQGEWQAVMGWNESYWLGDNQPVGRVTWFDAVEYCNLRSVQEGYLPAYTISGATTLGYHITGAVVTPNWSANGYRLPTEAEWEYACRAGSPAAFCDGGITNIGCTPVDANLDQVGWYCGNAGASASTHDVGGKAGNAWGLHDTHGNASEWCWDWYGNYPGGAVTDPKGADAGSARVRRGGHAVRPASWCRSAARDGLAPGIFDCDLWDCPGLRLARTAQ